MRYYSVIITNYNRCNHLKIISNRIRELNKSCELILVDDCSNDDSISFAENSKLFDIIWSKKIRDPFCPSTCRNAGIILSNNNHIIFLDVDCYPSDNYFIGHDEMYDSFGDLIVSQGFTDYYSFDRKILLKKDRRRKWFHEKLYYNINPKYDLLYSGNFSITKDVINIVGLFDESYNGNWGWEDSDLGVRCYYNNIDNYINEKSLCQHLQHPINNDFKKNKEINKIKFLNKAELLKKEMTQKL